MSADDWLGLALVVALGSANAYIIWRLGGPRATLLFFREGLHRKADRIRKEWEPWRDDVGEDYWRLRLADAWADCLDGLGGDREVPPPASRWTTWTRAQHDAECGNGGCPGYDYHTRRTAPDATT